MNKLDVYGLVRATTESNSSLVVPRIFIEMFNLETAIFLSQLIGWAKDDAPVIVSMQCWIDNTYLTEYGIRNARETLRRRDIITEEFKKRDGPHPLVHITLHAEELVSYMLEYQGSLEPPERPRENAETEHRDDPAKTPGPSLNTIQEHITQLDSPSENPIPAARETSLEQAVVMKPSQPRVIIHARRKLTANDTMTVALRLAFRFPPKPNQRQMGRLRRLARQVLDNEYTEEQVKEVGISWWNIWPGNTGSAPRDGQFLERLEQHRIGERKWRKA